MELTEKKDASERILHWINYKLESPVDPAVVTPCAPKGKKIASVSLLSPDGRAPETVVLTREGDRVRFRLPALEVYNVAVLKLE